MFTKFFGRLFILAFLGGFSAWGQAWAPVQPSMDSLNMLIDSSADDTLRIQAAISKASVLILNNYPEAVKSAEWALELAQKQKYKDGMVDAYLILARLYYRSGEMKSMFGYLDSLDQWSLVDLSKSQMTEKYNLYGLAYYKLNRYTEALEAWELAWKYRPEEKTGQLLGNLGTIYLSGEAYLKAEELFLSAADFHQKIGRFDFLTMNYLMAAYCHPHGDSIGIHFLNLAEEAARKIDFTRVLPSIYLERVYHNSKRQNFRAAAHCLDSLRRYSSIRELEILPSIYPEGLNAYRYHLALYKDEKGIKVISGLPEGDVKPKHLFKMAREYFAAAAEQTSELRIRVYQYAMLAEMEVALGNYKSASNYYNKSLQLKDANSRNHAQFLLADIERKERARIESETKRLAEIELRENSTRLNKVRTAGAMFILLALGLWFRLNYTRRSKKRLQVEMDRSERLLLNILPEEIAQELKDSGKAEARGFDVVSILFTDFKDFTQTSETLTAKDLVKELSACFEAFDMIMDKYNIEKIKTIGDAYMAAGGLPVPSPDSVKNTVLAGLEMQAFMASRKEQSLALGKPYFEMRVGIHTGPVVAGIVGVKKFQYDVWGDTVNTASRIESSGEVGKVNISETTYRKIMDDPDFTFEGRGKVKAKGKGEMEMHFVSLAVGNKV